VRGEGSIRFWWGYMREIDQLKYPDVEVRIIFRWIFRKWECGGRT
jgi:hypothetical protein